VVWLCSITRLDSLALRGLDKGPVCHLERALSAREVRPLASQRECELAPERRFLRPGES
jgi:hypothetical protein